MLSRVKILFENGALGSVAPGADGVLGLIVTATTVGTTFELTKPYVLRRLDDLAQLGITQDPSDSNAFVYKHVKEFYDEAGEGAELWIMGFPNTLLMSDLAEQTQDTAKLLIQAANGRLKGIGIAVNPASGYSGVTTNELDADVMVAAANAQALAEWATNKLYAPIFVLLEARGFTGTVANLPNLQTHEYNRVCLLLGDTVENSGGAAIGLLLGRIARIPVQRHIGRVIDGALKTLKAYIGDAMVEQTDVETINDKGFITFRTFTGKAGYYFADDGMSTAIADDYHSLARRRTIDKAYRIAYETLVNFVNAEIPITDSGELVPAMAKSWESEVESSIIAQMTAEGNLGVDTTNADDNGVVCYINHAQKVVQNNKIEISLKVKPYGYAKYIDVKLGFITINN